MGRIIDASSALGFARATYDTNFLHDDESMWEKHKLPAIVPGLQLLCSSLATMEEGDLVGINSARGSFTSIVPVGSEVNFSNKLMKKTIRLSAMANTSESLGDGKDNYSSAEKLNTKNRIGFYEAANPITIRPNDNDLSYFQEITGLPKAAVPSLYAAAISTASIVARISGPVTPSWMDLNRGVNAEEGKVRLPTYEAVEFYFPGGIRGYESREGLQQRSAIMRGGKNAYVIDTTCHDGDRMLVGVRSHLKQNSLKVVLGFIGRTLRTIEKSGNPGALEETVSRWNSLKGDSGVTDAIEG